MQLNKSCAICKSNSNVASIDKIQKEGKEFTLFECEKCNGQFWDPFVNPGSTWYESGNRYATGSLVRPEVTRIYHKDFLERYGNSLKRKSILDVGCGTAEFLAAAREKGAEVWGVDFDTAAIEAAKKHFGLENIHVMSLESFLQETQGKFFDFVTCFEVIEHVDDPQLLVHNLSEKLKPKGTLVLSTPSRDRLLPNLNSWDFPPNHLSRWNKESLQNILKSGGLQLESLSYGEQWKFLLEGINSKFRFGLTKKVTNISSSESMAQQTMNSMVALGKIKEYIIGAVPATVLWLAAMALQKKGGTMIAIARKIDA